MPDRRIGRHHQVQIADHRRRLDERAGRFVQPAGQIENRKIDLGHLLRAKALLQADQPHAAQAGQRRKLCQRNRTPPIGTMIARALPGDADLEAIDPGQVRAPLVGQIGIGRKVGNLAGHRRSQGVRSTHQRQIKVRRRQVARAQQDELIPIGSRGEQSSELRLNGQHDPPGECLEHPQVAQEMERISQALLGEHQQGATGQRFALPARQIGPLLEAGESQAGFVSAPAGVEFGFEQVANRQAQFRVWRIGGDRLESLKSLAGFGHFELFPQYAPQFVVRPDVIRFQCDGLRKAGRGLVELPLVPNSDAQVIVRLGIFWIVGQRLPVPSRGLVEPALFAPQVAQVVVCRRESGLERQGLLVMGRRFVEPVLLGQGDAEVAMGLGEVRLQGQRSLVTGGRLLVFFQLPQHVAQRVMCLGVAGLQSGGSLVMHGGQIEPILCSQHVAQVVVGVGQVWVERDRLLEMGLGLLDLPLLAERRAEIVVHLGQIGTQGQNLAISGHGLGQPTGAMLAHRQGKQRLQIGRRARLPVLATHVDPWFPRVWLSSFLTSISHFASGTFAQRRRCAETRPANRQMLAGETAASWDTRVNPRASAENANRA